ncbi:MAG: hypothetical protein LC689_02190 [Myxococcales bacterium]|nr:hypothetical protein [Myxococcales bacterium]
MVQPEAGVYASADGGATWTFAPGGYDFREVIFSKERIWARGATRVFRSPDGGRTWAWVDVVRGGDSLDAMALGSNGFLYVAGRSQLYVSSDGAQTWRSIALQLPPGTVWRARSIVPDPSHAQIVYLSIRSEPPGDLLARFKALLDFSSEEAVSALRLVDSHDAAPGAVSWGKGADGVYATQDGGALWKRTGLAVDAWLAFHDGALYAAAADPILEAAALIRRYPDLAGAADRQMKGGGVSPAVLREACPFPGRDHLLKGPLAATLAFRSTDGGATWSKLDDLPLAPALALRPNVGDSGTQYLSPTYRPPPATERRTQPYREASPNFPQTRYGGRGLPRHPPSEQGQGAAPRALSPELLLSFVDPIRLVAHFNGGLPLSGVADDVAYAATQPYWDALVKALADESQEEGEISLGPGRVAWTGGAAYELLHRESGAWTPLAGEPPQSFPRSIAPGIFLVGGNGRAWAIRRR